MTAPFISCLLFASAAWKTSKDIPRTTTTNFIFLSSLHLSHSDLPLYHYVSCRYSHHIISLWEQLRNIIQSKSQQEIEKGEFFGWSWEKGVYQMSGNSLHTNVRKDSLCLFFFKENDVRLFLYIIRKWRLVLRQEPAWLLRTIDSARAREHGDRLSSVTMQREEMTSSCNAWLQLNSNWQLTMSDLCSNKVPPYYTALLWRPFPSSDHPLSPQSPLPEDWTFLNSLTFTFQTDAQRVLMLRRVEMWQWQTDFMV